MISPEMQLPVSERLTIGSKRRNESITLPDGQIVTVSGERQKSTLRFLITAFKEKQPFVSNEELLGVGTATAQGIPRTPIQTRELCRKAVTGLKKKILTGTGWNIQSITVNGKGLETGSNGYILVLKKDQAHKVYAPTSYLESILDNKPVLKDLVTDGREKASILEKAKQQINSFDPQEKIIFLEKTFAILSDPDPECQNKRDATLELLNIMDLKSIDPNELTKTYTEAVSALRENLNYDSDPYGEIHMLLAAGKTIAPFIEKCQRITQLWNRVAQAFEEDDRQKILDDINEVRRLMPRKPQRKRTKQVGIPNETVKLPNLS